jgi:nitrite reductase/ring-hydroxylating ferredoxin subunit
MTTLGDRRPQASSAAGAAATKPSTTPGAGVFGLPDGWWPVAHSDEIGQHPGAYRLGDQKLAIYRDLELNVRAVEDRCPHRRLPLSMGRLTEDGSIQCPYHGWSFDGATGKCTAIPNLSEGERIPNGIRVAAFSAAENVAELIGYGLRTNKLAPPVGPPTGEEPDAGTTMYAAQSSDGLVFVWTGTQSPPTPAARLAAAVVEDNPLSGTVEIRAPHALVADAMLVNPGAALALGGLVGAGEELYSPTVKTSSGGRITVQRDRYALDLPRLSTFEPLSRRVVSATIFSAPTTGFTRVQVEAGRRTPSVDLVIGLTPISAYRTVVRWRLLLSGPGRRVWTLAARTAASGRRLAGRSPDAAERLCDDVSLANDPGVRALRAARSRESRPSEQ